MHSIDVTALLAIPDTAGKRVTDGGEPAGTGYECILRGCGNEIAAERDDGYCSDRCKEANAEIQEAREQNRRAERRRSGEADVLRVAEGGDR